MQLVWTGYIFIGLKTTECALIPYFWNHLNLSHLSRVLLLLKSANSNSLLTESNFHSSDGANYQKKKSMVESCILIYFNIPDQKDYKY